MDLTITGKNLEINDTIRKYVEKKIGRLDRYLPYISDGRVELTVAEGARAAEDRQIAQVTLRTKKVILRAEEASSDIFASIDAVFEKMQRQVDRYKGKRSAKREPEPARAGEIAESEDDTVRRSALCYPSQAVPNDAHERDGGHRADGTVGARLLRLLQRQSEPGHVLYRRRNGEYGLIEAELV